MPTQVSANLTLQKSLGTSLVLFLPPLPSPPQHCHQKPSLYPPILSSLLSLGPLGAADTLLSITQLICEAELSPGGKIAYQVKQLLLNRMSVFSRAPILG